MSTLRAQLSRILDAVQSGEDVEILDRSIPIARLVPVIGVFQSQILKYPRVDGRFFP